MTEKHEIKQRYSWWYYSQGRMGERYVCSCGEWIFDWDGKGIDFEYEIHVLNSYLVYHLTKKK